MTWRRIVTVSASVLLLTALVSGESAIPGFDARQALASCITWQGGQNCDNPAPRTNYRYQAPARSQGGGGYRSYGGGGGGGRAGAALGAASAAIGILGVMLDAAQDQQNAADASQRQAYNACQARIHKAYGLNEQARRLVASENPDNAYHMFEAALRELGDCGTRDNLAKLRHNLENARQDYVALTHPSEATRYGGDAQKSRLPTAADLETRAAGQCKNMEPDSPQLRSCMQRVAAQLIMLNDENIQTACQSLADPATRNRCAFNRYGAVMNGQNPDQFGDNDNCYFDEHGRPCHPGGSARVAPDRSADGDPNSLRNRLKGALAEKSKEDAQVRAARAGEVARAKALRDSLPENSSDRKALDDVIAKAEAGQVPAAVTLPAASSTPADQSVRQAVVPDANAPAGAQGAPQTDDAYANYMNSGTKSSGGKNNGDLGHPDFSMSGSTTQREIDRLTHP